MPFDVVLMDVQMPTPDGLEATRQIRRLPGAQPFIGALTASAMESDRETCVAAGMDTYVAKPIRPEALSDALALAPASRADGRRPEAPAMIVRNEAERPDGGTLRLEALGQS